MAQIESLRLVRLVVIAIAALLTTGCAGLPAPDATPHTTHSTAAVRVQGRWLLVHLSRPTGDLAGRPLVVYVTGDRGWGGKDLDTYHHLRTWGQPVVGFSAPDYLDHLRGGTDSLSPQELARDFADIIDATLPRLGLAPGTPVVLAGVSRGADLVVVAAGDPSLRSAVAGVLAVALTDEEEYVRRSPRRLGGHLAGKPLQEPPLETVKPYEYIGDILSPLALIQSTSDEYVPASRAAALFGPNTPLRRFDAITARNHSFSDARDRLYGAMHVSLDWILHASPARIPGGG